MRSLVRVGSISGIPERTPVAVRAGKHVFVIVKDGERIYCVQAVCPHGRWIFTSGTYANGKLTCKGHNMVVDLETGVGMIKDAKYKVKLYKVHIKDGDIYIEL